MLPFIIGIAGGSGSGKTTFCLRLIDQLPENSVVLLQHDSYYKELHNLTFEERSAMNFDHPDALDTALCVEHLRALKRNEAIAQPLYDFSTHLRKQESRHIEPRPLVLVEGILIFSDASLRKECDLRIFLDVDDEIRFARRMKRDTIDRGRSEESVREQYRSTVQPMYDAFVEPSKKYSDIIIPTREQNDRVMNILVNGLRALISPQ